MMTDIPRNQILEGHALSLLRELPSASVQCVVSSPPYYLARMYGTEPQIWGGDASCDHEWQTARYYREGGNSSGSRLAFSVPGAANAARIKETRWKQDDTCARCNAWRGELGQERTPDEFVAHLVDIFREVRRVLAPSGTAWVNLGDGFAGAGYANHTGAGGARRERGGKPRHASGTGLPEKNLMLTPFRFVLAAQADGWIVRNDTVVVWHKEHAMPDPARDRLPKTHEYVFLLAKAPRYAYNASQELQQYGTVWTLPTCHDRTGHPAPMQVALAERCIELGSQPGDLVLDPFSGLGTTALAAKRLGRDYLGLELLPQSAQESRERIYRDTLPAALKQTDLTRFQPVPLFGDEAG